MIRRLFIDHPASVGESYADHFCVATTFGVTMICGGLCALVHAVIPGWFITAASDAIQRLNLRMVEHRGAKAAAVLQHHSVEWII